MKVEIKKLHPNAIIPAYQSAMAAGLDLHSAMNEPVEIGPQQQALIKCGIAVHINDPGYAAVILPRSGLGNKGLVLGNLTGLIDADYQGELMVCAWNRTDGTVFSINPGDRIAQLVFLPVMQVEFEQVAEFSASSERGDKGFGSTGVAK